VNTKNTSPIRAIVTGGASGLGLNLAENIVALGGRVAILDRNEQKVLAVAARLGTNSLAFPVDTTKQDRVDEVVGLVTEEFGDINLLVNCAGIVQSKRVLGLDSILDIEEFTKIIQINLIGTFCVCRAVANLMQHNQPNANGERGLIINTSSIAATEGQIGQSAYAASKGGVASMTLPLAREFAKFGIRVMCIAPGVFHTPMYDAIPEKAHQDLEQRMPFPKHPGNPQQFSDLALHIVNNIMLNGEVIRLDGALRL